MDKTLSLTLQDIYVIADTLQYSLGFVNWSGVDEVSRRRVWNKIVDSQIVVAKNEETGEDRA